MDVRYEALLRMTGLFLSVYFTLGWGRKSKPEWDAPMMLGAIMLAVMLKYFGK
jgi:hypothetical protein